MTQVVMVTLEVVTCPGCGFTYGLPEGFLDARQEDAHLFRCPNADCPWLTQSFPKSGTTAHKLRETRQILKEERFALEACQRRIEHLGHRANGYKGLAIKRANQLRALLPESSEQESNE